jgi:hypothetical protein
MYKNPQYNMSLNGSVHNVTSFGVSDAHVDFTIYNGQPPYKVVTSVDGVVLSTIENIPDDENGEGQVSVKGLPPGSYKIEVWDSLTKEQVPEDQQSWKVCPQYLPAMTTWNVVSPPYVTLNGSCNPLGKATVVSFEVGENVSYGHEVQYGTVDGTDPISISMRLTAVSGVNNPTSFLVPSTTYHYRIKGISGANTIYGEDMTFTTPDPLPILITLPATNIQ